MSAYAAEYQIECQMVNQAETQIVNSGILSSASADRKNPKTYGRAANTFRLSVLLLALVLFALQLVFPCCASSQSLPPFEKVMPDGYVPEEYSFEEFPQWLRDVRRYEVIAVGSFPVAFFATSLIYDYSVFGMHNFDPAYSAGTQRSNHDIAIIAGTAAGVSLLIATTDIIIELVQRNKRKKAHEESELQSPAP